MNAYSSFSPSQVKIRYQRACSFMQGFYSKKIAFNDVIYPVWISNTDCFWYISQTRDTQEYRLVNAKANTNEPAFDQKALAVALAEAAEKDVDADNLPIDKVEISFATLTVSFRAFGKRWHFNADAKECVEIPLYTWNDIVSPDGRYLVFPKDHNLWLRNLSSGEERPLTTDGEALNRYGATGACWGWELPGGLQVRWSPDSKRIFTVQRDQRGVEILPVVHHMPSDGSIRPKVEYLPIAYAGDEYIETLRLLVIDVDMGKQISADYEQIPTTRNQWGFFDARLGWWGKESELAYFVHVDRYYKFAKVIEFNTTTGKCRELFEETSSTHIDLMLDQDEYPALLPLPETDELLWFSERTGWAHYYLYDLKTGKLKNAVTSGPGLARYAVAYIPERRELFVQMAGKVEGRDPYYRDLTRVNIDTGEMVTLVSSDHEYLCMGLDGERSKISLPDCTKAACGVSPTGNYAVVTRTRADEPSVSYVVDRNGNKVMDLECADLSGVPEGWHWPEPFSAIAADQKTTVYGLMFKPTCFDPEQRWPVLSVNFNQPEMPTVPKGSFAGAGTHWRYYMTAASLAELGFIVVMVDGRGSPGREKAFFDMSYGCSETANHIDDHVAAIKQLVKHHPYMDLDRVGIAPMMSGGSGCLEGMLSHPEFFKVGVTPCLHDARLFTAQNQTDKYDGPGMEYREHQYPEDRIEKLQGKLLLLIGMLDPCSPPAASFRVVEALMKANKDFEMLAAPNLAHNALHPQSLYMHRRAWDFLVRHLIGVEPPTEFQL